MLMGILTSGDTYFLIKIPTTPAHVGLCLLFFSFFFFFLVT